MSTDKEKKDIVNTDSQEVDTVELSEFLEMLEKGISNKIDLPQGVIYSVNALQGVWCNSHNLLVINPKLLPSFSEKLLELKKVCFEILEDLDSEDSRYFKNLDVLVAKTNKLSNEYRYLNTQIKNYEKSKNEI